MNRSSENKGTVILIILIVLTAAALIIFYSTRENISIELTDDVSKHNGLGNTDLFNSIVIEDMLIGKDSESSRIFCYIPEDKIGEEIELEFVSDSDSFKLNETVRVISDYDESSHITVNYSGRKYCFDIVFTNLPIIVIDSSKDISYVDGSKDNEADTMVCLSKDGCIREYYKIPSVIKLHGNTSLRFPKKAYKASFSEKGTLSVNGMHEVNSLILDAAYTDQSRIRNLLCSRIWSDISKGSPFDLSLEGYLTEVFYNNEYLGIYVCKTPVNRSGLGLEKTTGFSTPVVVKAESWIKDLDAGSSYSGITEQSAFGFELKYPNDKALFSKAWSSVLPELADFYDPGVKKTLEVTTSVFDLDNYINAKLLNLLICNTDNQLSKNNYFFKPSLNSEHIYIVPWDMDLTLGLAWSNKEEDDEFGSALVPETAGIIQRSLFLQPDSPEIEDAIKQRWIELRNSTFTDDYFDVLIKEYTHTLGLGALEREKERWGYPENIVSEIEYIERWLDVRITTIDKFAENAE